MLKYLDCIQKVLYICNMKVQVELLATSQPMIFENAKNTYTKDGLFCVYMEEINKVYKFPLSNIFRIVEDYSTQNIRN